MNHHDTDPIGYEEVICSSTTNDIEETSDMLLMVQSLASVPVIQKRLLPQIIESPSSTTNQSQNFESEIHDCCPKPALPEQPRYGMRFLNANGDYQIRAGRLPTPGPPPASESEASKSESENESPVASQKVEPAKSRLILKLPVTPRPLLRAQPKIRLKVANTAKLSQALRAARAARIARAAILAARAAKQAKQAKAEKKARKRARNVRHRMFLIQALAFQEEMERTDQELTERIAAGREKIAAIRERRRQRALRKEARHEARRERLLQEEMELLSVD